MEPWTNGFTIDVANRDAGKRGHRVAQAQALVNAAALSLAGAEWLAKARVRKSLMDWHATRQREELLAAQEKDQQEALKLFDARIAAGESSQVESLQPAALQSKQAHHPGSAEDERRGARLRLPGPWAFRCMH